MFTNTSCGMNMLNIYFAHNSTHDYGNIDKSHFVYFTHLSHSHHHSAESLRACKRTPPSARGHTCVHTWKCTRVASVALVMFQIYHKTGAQARPNLVLLHLRLVPLSFSHNPTIRAEPPQSRVTQSHAIPIRPPPHPQYILPRRRW